MRGFTNRSLQPRTKAIVLVVYIAGGMLGGMPTIHMIVLKDICFPLNALFARAKFGRLTPKTMIFALIQINTNKPQHDKIAHKFGASNALAWCVRVQVKFLESRQNVP